jgi:hypothetical protein
MPFPHKALELENQSLIPNGEPALAVAYQVLKDEWDRGNREREVLLHLLFLAWYGLCEPAHITGFPMHDGLDDQLQDTFHQIHAYVQPVIDTDAEMLYVVGLMAHLFPYLLGDTREWQRRSERYQLQYRALAPQGLDPGIFQHRGAYGEYFAGQAQVSDGY